MELDRELLRSMIIQEARQMKRNQVIYENNVRMANFMIQKEALLVSEGLSRREINEGVIDFLGSMLKGLPGGFVDMLEQAFIGMLLRKLGVDPSSLLGSIIGNVVEEIDIMSMGKYFGDGGCEEIVETIFDGVSEALQEKALDYIFGAESASAGMFAGTARESFAKYLNSSEFAVTLKAGIKEMVCNIDFTKLGDSIKSGLGGVFGGSSAPASGGVASGF